MSRIISSSGQTVDLPNTNKTESVIIKNIPVPVIAGSLAASLAFLVYLITLAPGITWSHFGGDGGELITAAITLGVPHPPGYPTYILLGNLFSKIPIGSVAWRFNLFSAVAGMVAVALITAATYDFLQGLNRRFIASVAAGLAFAFTPLVWSQSIITEVYTLNIAISAALLWTLLGKKPAWISGLFLGLAITTHLSSLLYIPLVIIMTDKTEIKKFALGIIFGLLPLVTLPILGIQGSPVIWGEPTSWRGWWEIISARIYQPNLALTIDALNTMSVSTWSTQILPQFAWVGWLFIAIGIVKLKSSNKNIIAILGTALIFALFSIVYNTDDSIINFMPVLLLLTPILAAGLSRLGPFAMVLPLILILLNFQNQNLRSDTQIRDNVHQIMVEIPQNAIVLTPGDQSIFALWYFTNVENIRPDITPIDKNLFAFDWYRRQIKTQWPFLDALGADDLPTFISLNKHHHSICELSLHEPQQMHCITVLNE